MVLVTSKKKRPTPVHHKRRRGEHHKKSHDYHKAYWPYLPMALIVTLGILANTYWGAIQHRVLDYATSMSANGLLQKTNEERVGGGLANLTINSKLNNAAQAKANDMAARNYWSHNTPEGSPPWVFVKDAGYDYKTAGENLAYGFDNSTETVVGWMNSSGHRANIMNDTYTEVGFGIANAADFQNNGPQTIVVAMYASPRVTATARAQTTTPPPAPTTQAQNPAPTPTPAPTEPTPEPDAAQPTNVSTPTEELAVAQNADSDDIASPEVTPAVSTKKIARVQLLSGATAAWSAFAISSIATVALAVFFLRHGLLLRRAWVKSERFVHKHPAFDIALVAVATIGIVLTQTTGIIR